jgi:hypothetical protein
MRQRGPTGRDGMADVSAKFGPGTGRFVLTSVEVRKRKMIGTLLRRKKNKKMKETLREGEKKRVMNPRGNIREKPCRQDENSQCRSRR